MVRLEQNVCFSYDDLFWNGIGHHRIREDDVD